MKRAPPRGQLEVLGVRQLEGHRLLADVTELLGEPPAMRVPDVDDRRRPASIQVGLGEEPALGVVVLLERPVEVEVILAQVREDEDGEADPEQALQRGAVGGGLHGGASVSGVEHLAQEALDVDRLGGRPHRGAPLAADPVLDGAEETRAPAGRGKDGEEEKRGRRLPVRSRDPGDLELARRVAEEGVGRKGHRLAGVRDDELRHRQVELALDDQCGGAVGDGLRCVVVPVRLHPGDADEESPRSHAPCVVGQVGDVDGGRVRGARGVHGVGQELEVDGAGV